MASREGDQGLPIQHAGFHLIETCSVLSCVPGFTLYRKRCSDLCRGMGVHERVLQIYHLTQFSIPPSGLSGASISRALWSWVEWWLCFCCRQLHPHILWAFVSVFFFSALVHQLCLGHLCFLAFITVMTFLSCYPHFILCDFVRYLGEVKLQWTCSVFMLNQTPGHTKVLCCCGCPVRESGLVTGQKSLQGHVSSDLAPFSGVWKGRGKSERRKRGWEKGRRSIIKKYVKSH